MNCSKEKHIKGTFDTIIFKERVHAPGLMSQNMKENLIIIKHMGKENSVIQAEIYPKEHGRILPNIIKVKRASQRLKSQKLIKFRIENFFIFLVFRNSVLQCK